MFLTRTRRIGAVIATAAAASVMLGGALAPSAMAVDYDTTSAKEKKRVDSVPTPKLDWWNCSGETSFTCASVKLPIDYDKPNGAKTEVAVARYRSPDQKERLGTLFVNPGGPGGSAVDFAYFAPELLSPEVTEHYDIVGIDPRGIGYGDQLKCFADAKAQQRALDPLFQVRLPVTAAEQKAHIGALRNLAKGCATTGKKLATSMSTAEVARDMDVIRRAVGDKKLTYLGISYGTYLGQVYANMFPDRVKAIVIDGVLDPVAWAGTKATASIPLESRLASAAGATKALHELLVRCDQAGPTKCRYSAGDPVKNYDKLAEQLKARPVTIDYFGQPLVYGYGELVGDSLSALYSAYAGDDLTFLLTTLEELMNPAAKASPAKKKVLDQRAATLIKKINDPLPGKSKRVGKAFPYGNGIETFNAVTCSDSLNTSKLADRSEHAAAEDKKSKYFGSAWIWQSAACSDQWTAKDEDAYRGSFTKRTSGPMLVIGNYWDPATNYRSAVSASKLAPNSQLLSSDSWGHAAIATSECVDDAIARVLVQNKFPAKGTTCVGDAQPFVDDLEPEEAELQLEEAKLNSRRMTSSVQTR